MDEPPRVDVQLGESVAPQFITTEVLQPIPPMRRALYLVAAAISFGLGIIGIAVPGVPTVPFVLLTSFFLLRGSPILNARLHRSKTFGPMLRDWERHHGVRRRVKLLSFATIAVTLGISLALLSASPAATIGIGLLSLVGLVVVWRVPTIPN
jgi:uncharacterized membrane protein YbaN (DUF454 family)